MRRVCYISGTRADFGLMARTLLLAQQSGKLEVSVCVTGMHLSPVFGNTVNEIVTSSLRICGKVPVELDGDPGGVLPVDISVQPGALRVQLPPGRPRFARSLRE